MIYLITGVPGAGKTLRAVSMLAAAREEGRLVYHNIAGYEHGEPAPSDWRDTPEGSLVVYDEAQRDWPSDGKPGVSSDDRIRAMETHRHTGHDLVFVTQAPTLVHHHIRKLVGTHYHHQRAAGLQGAAVSEWARCCDTPNDSKEQRGDCIKHRWAFPKSLYGQYKSATLHTHKRRIPPRLVALGVFLVAAFTFGAVMLSNSKHLNPDEGARGGAQAQAQRAAPLAPGLDFDVLRTAQAEPVRVMGCISSASRCMCFNGEGSPLQISDAECRLRTDKPLLWDIKGSSSRDGGKAG